MDKILIQSFVDLKEKEVLDIVKDILNIKQNPYKVLNELQKAMVIIGERFATGEYFISELIYSAEIMKKVQELIKPELSLIAKRNFKYKGKIIIGTVEGDIHNIGKDLVVFMLEANGFEVYDLGVDVPPKIFVDKFYETKAEIIGLSGLLTLAFDSMKKTIEMINTPCLKGKVKIMIGGSQVDETVRKYTGADAFGKDAMSAVLIAKDWVGVK